jgi:glycine/D-amino acid oxidase-like deaminating enzyme
MDRFAEILVVGGGIAGVMTALSLRRQKYSVTLIDRWEPGHPRASSSDYHRILRSIHGKDEIYTQWVRDSRLRWMELQRDIGRELYVETGCLIMAEEGGSAWEDATIPTFQKMGIPHHVFTPDELRLRFPQFKFTKVAYGLYEPEAGFVYAHRAVTEIAALFQREGGRIIRGRVTTDEAERPLLDGKPLAADVVIMTTGPWLGAMFPRTVKPIVKVVRQDVVYTSTPDGDARFDAGKMPCWIDHGYGAYGIPSALGHGVKAAIAWSDIEIDLDNDDRVVEASAIARSRQYLTYRFPALADQRVLDQKACQIAMTPDTHFIIDHHPAQKNLVLVGGCSGHLFKHGPVVGDFIAGVATGKWGTAERFKIGARGGLSKGDSPSGR